MAHRSLAEFVAFLRQAETVPRPDGEDWKAMIARIHVTGTIAEIDDDSSSHCTSCHAFSECKGLRLPVFDSMRRRR